VLGAPSVCVGLVAAKSQELGGLALGLEVRRQPNQRMRGSQDDESHSVSRFFVLAALFLLGLTMFELALRWSGGCDPRPHRAVSSFALALRLSRSPVFILEPRIPTHLIVTVLSRSSRWRSAVRLATGTDGLRAIQESTGGGVVHISALRQHAIYLKVRSVALSEGAVDVAVLGVEMWW
jgi:hypothetical protein